MKSFLQLNRDKLLAIFGRLSLILLGLVSIVLIIAYMTGNLPNGQLLLSIIVITAIGFPLVIMFLGYVGWLINRNARQKAFSKPPFCDIENIGFYKAYLGDKSKWSFTDEIRRGELCGFTITMDISKEKGHTLEFDIPTKWKKLDKTEFRQLTEKFKQLNIDFRVGSLVKQYDSRQPILSTIYELKEELENTAILLRQEGFEPKL